MSRSVLFITHLDEESGGVATRWLADLPITRLNRPTSTIDLETVAGIVIFGGSMSAADIATYPSLEVTAQIARDAIAADIPVLGLCLGHQILGRALGATHHENAVDETGLVPVEIIAEDPYLAGFTGEISPIQWHTDTVELPEGATLLARNAAVPNQAFRYGSAVGMQFHLEADDAVIEQWSTHITPAMDEGYPAGTRETWQEQYRRDTHLHALARAGFAAFAADARTRLQPHVR